jgi:arylsulfatase A-like enzyme
VSHKLVANMDILPTIAELTGVDLSAKPVIDGKSILAHLQHPDTASPSRQYFLYYFAGDRDGDGHPDLDAIRDADGWKLQILNMDGREIDQLFYLPNDIGTGTDVSLSHPEKVEELMNAARAIDAEIEAHVRPEWRR